jgi:hypothetical protein
LYFIGFKKKWAKDRASVDDRSPFFRGMMEQHLRDDPILRFSTVCMPHEIVGATFEPSV